MLAVLALPIGGISLTARPALADTPVPSVISLEAPSSVGRNAPVSATGVLTTDPGGTPIGGAVLDWRETCLTEGAASESSGQATTSDDGTFEITYYPGYCTRARLIVTWSGAAAADLDRVSADTSVPWRVGRVQVDAPALVYVGDDDHATVTYTVDGVPTAGEEIQVDLSNASHAAGDPILAEGTTDADGRMTFPVPTTIADWYSFTLVAEPTSDTMPAYSSGEGAVSPVPTDVTLGPNGLSDTVGQSFDVSGTVSRVDDNVSGLLVYVYENDHDGLGWQGLGTTLTEANGHYSMSVTPLHAGLVSFSVTVPGSSDSQPLRRRYIDTSPNPVEDTVVRRTTELTLTSDHPSYVAGQTAEIHVGYLNPPTYGRMLDVIATPPSGRGIVLFDDVIWPEGATIEQTMTTNVRITATVSSDTYSSGDDVSLDVRVREALRAHAKATAYDVDRAPLLSAANASGRSGECLTFGVQKRTRAGWVKITGSRCRLTDRGGTARWRSPAPRHLNTLYRFRAGFGGDALDLAALSPWQKFRFRST